MYIFLRNMITLRLLFLLFFNSRRKPIREYIGIYGAVVAVVA